MTRRRNDANRTGIHRWPVEALARIGGERAGYRIKMSGGELRTDGRPGASRARVDILEPIGGWFGVDAAELIRDLVRTDVDEIELHINSPGGDVFDGVAIYEALLSHRATVTAHVDGLAASAASFIAQAGNEVIIGPNAMMMIHEAHGFVFGNAPDMTAMAELLEKIGGSLADLYAERCGGSAEEWRAAMRAETWYTAAEAVDAGLATSIRPATAREREDAEPVEDRAARIARARARVDRVFNEAPAPAVAPAVPDPPSPVEGAPDGPAPDEPTSEPESVPDAPGSDAGELQDLAEQIRSAFRPMHVMEEAP